MVRKVGRDSKRVRKICASRCGHSHFRNDGLGGIIEYPQRAVRGMGDVGSPSRAIVDSRGGAIGRNSVLHGELTTGSASTGYSASTAFSDTAGNNEASKHRESDWPIAFHI